MSYSEFVATPTASADGVECMGVKVSDMTTPGNERQFVVAKIAERLPRDVAQRKLVAPRSVVFPKRGAAIATNKKRLTTTWTVLDPNLIALRPKDGVDPDYLHCWAETFDLRTITEPGPTPQLNKKDLVPIQLPIPNDPVEQREIAEAVKPVESKLRIHGQKLERLRELFGTLLDHLIPPSEAPASGPATLTGAGVK